MRTDPLYRLTGLTGHPGRCLFFLCLFLPTSALAHFAWLVPATHTPEVGQPLDFRVGQGHHFSEDEYLGAERLSDAVLAAPGEVPISFALRAGEHFSTPSLPVNGPYVLGIRQVRGYYSRTPGGGKRGSRLEYPDAVSCSYSGNTMKAVLGRGTGAGDQRLGHPLELLPLENPSALKPGGILPIRVLLEGEPARVTVDALYAGYHPREGEADYPVSVTPDADGLARIPLDRSGPWLVIANVKVPFEDTRVCDQHSYTSTLTFRIP